jgi:nitrogen fixation NifU-like protein
MSAPGNGVQEDLTELFRATILEHARHPRNRGATLVAPDIESRAGNISCGDRATLRLCVDDAGIVTAIEWEGDGCAISQASLSMMSRAVLGKSLAEIDQLIAAFYRLVRGDAGPVGMHLGELEALEGVRRFPARMKCASLGWQALGDGIARYRSRESA